MDLNLRFFFDGMQSKEQSASAFLATLLGGSQEFRASFFEGLPADPPLDPLGQWEVRVENGDAFVGSMDVTLQDTGGTTFVLIENKISGGSKETKPPGSDEPSQLLRYYRGARHTWPDKRVIAVYLAPDASLGEDEVRDVNGEANRRTPAAAGPDRAFAVTWGQIAAIIHDPRQPAAWFTTTGMAAVEEAMKVTRLALPPDEQRTVVRGLVAVARDRLRTHAPDLDIQQWNSNAVESIVLARAPLGLIVDVWFDASRTSKHLGEVVVEGRVKVRVETSFGRKKSNSANAPETPALVEAWAALASSAPPTVGTLPPLEWSRGRLRLTEDWLGSESGLTDLIEDRGRQVIDFMRQYLVLGQS